MIIFDFNTGGGSLIDKIIVKSNTIPEAGKDYVGAVYQYAGATDTNYTHGYIYECQQQITNVITFTPSTMAVSGADFMAFLAVAGVGTDYETVVKGTMTYSWAGDIWRFEGKDAEDNTIVTYQQYTLDYEDAGFTMPDDPEDGDVVSFEKTTTYSYGWVRIDVQPGISPEGETEQTVQGDLTLTSTDGAVGLSFENSSSSTSIGINSNGDLILSSTDGSVVVNTPDGTNEGAVVNVAYVNNIVGDIDTALDDIIAQ